MTDKLYLECKDHSVTKERFRLIKDEELDMLITIPRPSERDMPIYYKSENYISHTDSNKTFFDKIYQIVKKYTIRKKIKLINSLINKKGKLLDIGAGTGMFLYEAQKKGWEVIGIEPNENARQLSKQRRVNLTEKIEDLNDVKFDVITMWHVLEHVHDLNAYVEKIKKLLKDDGVLIIAVPNYKSYDAKHYQEHWAAFDVPRHLWHFSRTSIEKLFFKEKINVVKILPMKLDAYYVSLLSEKYKTGKINYIKAFKTAYMSNIKAKSTGEYSSLTYILKKAF